MSIPTVYGLTTCDTCRKARKWLAAHDIDHAFVDYRAQPVAAERLSAWAEAVGGWEKLVNRASTTWRGLPDADRQPASAAQWLALVQAHPQLVKRPVLETADGRVSVGFSDAAWGARFGR